ncbi:hypothetical protein FBU30_006926 [Linnemannia zychae]|nr:hypothetical protein FBU30_006926 [Linnemannia zychae]
MKFTIAAAVVALAATSQVAAVVPIPVKNCTHSYVVEPGTPGCQAFAEKFGITFKDLLAWNTKLREDCANLDIGYPMCVSVTPGDCCLNENPKGALIPQPGVTQTPMWDPAPYTKPPTGPTSTAAPSSTATTTGPAPTVTGTPTVPATVAPTVNKPSSTATATPNPPPPSAASSSKASMVLAVAGVVLSVAYML